MAYRHEAFSHMRQPRKADVEAYPHVITPTEREYIMSQLKGSRKVCGRTVKKLLRLYDERTAACLHLMKKHNDVPPDPEMG